MMLSDVCLSVAYIGAMSRIERPRKTEIDTEVAHVTCDSDTILRSKGYRSRSQGRGHIVAASLTACIMLLLADKTRTRDRQGARLCDAILSACLFVCHLSLCASNISLTPKKIGRRIC